jgi:hypothetical protein
VPTHVGDERLLARGERVEQVERRLTVVALVVPLQKNMDRDADPRASSIVERET